MRGLVVSNYGIVMLVGKRIFAVGIGAAVVRGTRGIRNGGCMLYKLVVSVAEGALMSVALGIFVSVGARIEGVSAKLAVSVAAGRANCTLYAGCGVCAGALFLTLGIFASLDGAFTQVVFSVGDPIIRELVAALCCALIVFVRSIGIASRTDAAGGAGIPIRIVFSAGLCARLDIFVTLGLYRVIVARDVA